MFKDYKALFKGLREAQEKLWSEATAWAPGAQLSPELDAWQRNMLGNLNEWAERAVEQSLELQGAWLEQWAGRATEKKVKPRMFAELSTDAQRTAQRWLEQQQDLWNQWMSMLNQGGTQFPGQAEMETAFREANQRQLQLLSDWAKMRDYEDLSMKELNKLTDQITKSMQKSIDTQRQLWSYWFDEMRKASETLASVVEPTSAAPTPAAPAKKSSSPAKAGLDDLKQISGIGPGLEKKLKDAGYTTFEQIAKLTDEQIDELEKTVIRFSGRIKRDDWMGQARKLMG